jgi:predicted acylesterase/phospholipase RssA
MNVTHPFGLALSGGGFRATAYHLGVLKRLRELGLLAQVDVISTVSGGSIAGAYWVYWQAFKGDSIADAEEWTKFETSLIDFMRSGVRERIFRVGFLLPAVLLGAIAGVCVWLFGPVGPGGVLLVALGVLAVAYVAWHYAAPGLLALEYERLFESEKLSALNPGREPEGSGLLEEMRRLLRTRRFGDPPRRFPDLYINATSLNSGSHVFFSKNQDLEIELRAHGLVPELFAAEGLRARAADPEGPGGALQARVAAINESFDGIDPFMPGLTRRKASVPMPHDTAFSKAVASSSAIPFVFSPIRYMGPLRRVHDLARERLWHSIDAEGPCWSVDGGVFDNQGTHLLLENACSSVIVSDGSGALGVQPNPSTWQMLPPGSGVVARSFDITYERSRDLGYIRLADRYERFCMLTDLSKLIGVPGLAPAVVDAVWRSRQRYAEFFADPIRALTHPEEILAFLSRMDRNLNDSAQPYDVDFLKEFRGWKRATATSTADTSGADRGPSEDTPRPGRDDVGYLRDQLLKKLERYAPYVTGYAYVELTPDINFGWRSDRPRLPQELIPLVAAVRTDLDCFSSAEISALMFHGYTTIDHCLWAYRSDWLPPSPAPSNFTFRCKGIFRDWGSPTEDEMTAATRHLSVSRSRFGLWRSLYRLIKRC